MHYFFVPARWPNMHLELDVVFFHLNPRFVRAYLPKQDIVYEASDAFHVATKIQLYRHGGDFNSKSMNWNYPSLNVHIDWDEREWTASSSELGKRIRGRDFTFVVGGLVECWRQGLTQAHRLVSSQ